DASRSPSGPVRPGSGSCTKITSASLPKPDSCPPYRPIAIIANLVGSGRPRSDSTFPTVAARTASSVAVVIAVSASPVCARSIIPSTFAAAQRADGDRALLRVAVVPPGRGHHFGAEGVDRLRHQFGVVGEQRDGLG